MTTKTDGGPAFPLPIDAGECRARFDSGYGGMSLRDFFAAKAMQASLSRGTPVNIETMAKSAYAYADAMLKARENR